jgi:hypothetical protein
LNFFLFPLTFLGIFDKCKDPDPDRGDTLITDPLDPQGNTAVEDTQLPFPLDPTFYCVPVSNQDPRYLLQRNFYTVCILNNRALHIQYKFKLFSSTFKQFEQIKKNI